MTVEWTRPDLDPAYVNLLQQGHIQSHPLNPLYHHWRTSLFAEELSHGNISLKIFSVQLEDEGIFQCFVPKLRSSTLIQLLVGAVSQPVISSAGPKDHGWSLTCDSGCWYPKPEVSWLDSEGNNITADSSEMDRVSQNCYAVQSNVTVRLTGNVTCRVHLSHINHTVETQYAISEFRVLMIPAEGGLTAGAIAGITVGGLVAALVAALAIWGCVCWNKEEAICWGAQKAQKNAMKMSFNHTNSENGDHTLTEPLNCMGNSSTSSDLQAHSM